MHASKWQKFLTKTDVIPSDKPLFPLRFLFIIAVCSSVIFYRFVYIYLYNSPLSKYLYDYRISYLSKTYIEGFFISTWIIFIGVLLFRISDFILESILIPVWKILSIAFFRILYTFDIITNKTFTMFRRQNPIISNKNFTNNSKPSKIKKEIKIKVSKNDRRKSNSTSLSRTQGKIKKKTS
ncbi:MAG: hypothetical protein J6J27_04905 [Alphaproteobacteria bacterium]|nr:hypothetical protein [Alphaproteobacteria bacterium]